MRCKECTSGFHAPYDRFERLGSNAAGPSFLMKCKVCGTLWHEQPRAASRLTRSDAQALFPGARL
jgi:hypothetical protein